MITHIVMFKFRDDDKVNFMKVAKHKLENLVNEIDVLKSMEVGVNYIEDDNMPDFSLVSKFDNKEHLAIYATHLAHLKVVELFKPMAISRWVVDSES